METLKMGRLDEKSMKKIEFIKETGNFLVEIESYKIVGDRRAIYGNGMQFEVGKRQDCPSTV